MKLIKKFKISHVTLKAHGWVLYLEMCRRNTQIKKR